MTCRRINRMPSNCEEKCKECFTPTTNDRNETNHFADCCRIIVVTLYSEAGATREKSAHARRCKENRGRGGGRSKKAWRDGRNRSRGWWRTFAVARAIGRHSGCQRGV